MFRSLSPAKILRFCSLAFLIGVAVASFLPVLLFKLLWIWSLLLSTLLITLFLIPRKYFMWTLMGLFFIVGIWRFGFSYNSSQALIDLTNGNYKGRAEIVEEPRWVASGQELIVKLVDDEREPLVSVKTAYQQTYQAGQIIWLSCKLRKSEASLTYLRARNLASACYQADVALLANKQSALGKLRKHLGASIGASLAEPAAGLANAMLFGQRQDLSPSLVQAFAKSGLGHLIAISGMNISLVIWLVMILALACGLRRQLAYYFTVALIALFVLLVGASASVVRAALMGILVISAAQVGRLPNFNHILVISAAFMVMYDPTWLIFDLGFQLSFLAILGLCWFYPGLSILFDRAVERCPSWSQKAVEVVGLIAIATVSAQLLTLPLLAARFGYLSVVSVPANVLAVWTMPIFMIAGLAATAVTLILPFGGLIFWLPVGLLLNYLIKLAYYFSGLSWAIVQVDGVWMWLIFLIYIPELYLARYLAKIVKNSDKNGAL